MLKPGPKHGEFASLPTWSHDPVGWYEFVTDRPLYQWQRDELAVLMGQERPDVAYIQVGRKNGKSALGAACAICEAARPRRHIYTIADSVRNLNSALMREIRDTINASPILSGAFVQFQNKIEVPCTGSFIETRPNNFQASQSINPHLIIFDEVHLQKDPDIWHGMRMAGAAHDDALLLGITTPGYDLNSPAHGFYQAIKAGNTTMYGKIFEPEDQQCEASDRDAWIQANPRLIDDPGFIRRLEKDFAELPEAEFRRFRMGQWTATAEAWLPAGTWGACAALSRTQPDIGTGVILGFDGSFSGDSTALVGATVGEEYPHVFIAGCWENPGKPGWRVPREAVHAAVDEAFKRYRVQAMYCDPPYWQREIEEWSQRYGADKILELPTGSHQRMAPLCTTFYSGVMERHISHDGDKRLTRHLNNCVTKPTMYGDVITKPDKNSPAKIDLAVAAVLAYGHAATAIKRRAALVVL